MEDKIIGKQNYNNKNKLMKIVKYYSDNNIIVRFISTGNEVCCTYQQFERGTVKSK